VFTLARQRVEPFTDGQIESVRTFADQAVIAIEIAQLFNELRDRTDELTLREDELRVTFDNMGDGVAMFDRDLRLAAWNRNFQQILDLPHASLAERPSYVDYVHALAERGEFSTTDLEAELSRRLEATDEDLRFERTRPDGRVIEVRRNVVPGGGFVMIYSDITERKRAETQIRAARDAAERALRELQTAQASLVHAQKDGGPRPAHRRHCPRDQEPAQLRQQFRRPLGRIAGRAEGNGGPGGHVYSATIRVPRSTKSSVC